MDVPVLYFTTCIFDYITIGSVRWRDILLLQDILCHPRLFHVKLDSVATDSAYSCWLVTVIWGVTIHLRQFQFRMFFPGLTVYLLLLIETINAFCHRVVVRVTGTVRWGQQHCILKPLRINHRHVLRSFIAMMDGPATGPSCLQTLLQHIYISEFSIAGNFPFHDEPGEQNSDEGRNTIV